LVTVTVSTISSWTGVGVFTGTSKHRGNGTPPHEFAVIFIVTAGLRSSPNTTRSLKSGVGTRTVPSTRKLKVIGVGPGRLLKCSTSSSDSPNVAPPTGVTTDWTSPARIIWLGPSWMTTRAVPTLAENVWSRLSGSD